MPGKRKPPLSDLENRVMTIVWKHGRATAELVRTEFEGDQPIKDSTVRTILRRLEEKGYVSHVTEGRTYVYSPTDASQNVAADAVRGIIERLCNGSVEDLLVGMIDRDIVSPAKLQELAKRIAAEKDRSAKGRKKKSHPKET